MKQDLLEGLEDDGADDVEDLDEAAANTAADKAVLFITGVALGVTICTGVGC